ncbi:thioredoxin-like protein 4A [Cebus imitator]|uniref:thioredoxin-like protein 4A n=1 Tax=Cebus imitator TaxID=2715852 RepID=UPI0018975F29|nr:thioredoxin-like protein 4A [Cebus imitator]
MTSHARRLYAHGVRTHGVGAWAPRGSAFRQSQWSLLVLAGVRVVRERWAAEAGERGPAVPIARGPPWRPALGRGERAGRHVVHAPAPAQRLAGGPGHPVGGGPRGRHPLRPRLGPHVHEDGRGPVQHRREEMADNEESSLSCYESCLDIPAVLKNKHIMIDLGTGNNNKINWAMEDKQEMVDIIETVYRGARKGRGLVVSPKDYSTKYRY